MPNKDCMEAVQTVAKLKLSVVALNIQMSEADICVSKTIVEDGSFYGYKHDSISPHVVVLKPKVQ